MSWADTLYGAPREEELYGEGFERPGSDRANAIGKLILFKTGENILRAIPNSTSSGVVGQFFNSVKSGLTTRANIRVHENGKAAFSNPIPVANAFLQNFWSAYHLGDGLTHIDYAYTVERGGREHLLTYGTPQDVPTLSGLRTVAENIRGSEEARFNMLLDRIPSDPEAIRSGVIHELTDGDIAEVRDLSKFQPTYSKAELWFIGRKGKRTLLGQTASGENIYAYERPSTADFWKYYGRMDMAYTFLDTAVGAAEKALGPGLAEQRVYEREIDSVIRSTARRYGNTRDDGVDNPFGRIGRYESFGLVD
jgi:hypothetical protein